MADNRVMFEGLTLSGYKKRVVESDLHGKPSKAMNRGAMALMGAVADYVRGETKYGLTKISSFYFSDGSGFLNLTLTFEEYESFNVSFLKSWLERHKLKPTLVRGLVSDMNITEVYIFNKGTLQLKLFYEHMY